MPVDPATAASSFAVKSWTYDHHEEYGCKPRDTRTHRVSEARAGAEGLTVDLRVEDLALVRVYEIRCVGLVGRGAEAIWHGVAWYTRNASPQ